MNDMMKYKVTEDIKDRYRTLFTLAPEIGLSETSVEDSAPIVAGIVERYNEHVAKGGKEDYIKGINYLLDTAAYYCALCSEMSITNKEVLDTLAQYAKRIDELEGR